MGCDVHGFIEYEVEREGEIYVSTFSPIPLGRNYCIFGLLTNGEVRYTPQFGSPLPAPRGLPERVSYEFLNSYTNLPHDEYNGEGFTTFENAKRYAANYGCRWLRQQRAFGGKIEFYDPEVHGPLDENGLPPQDQPNFNWRIEDPDWHSASYADAKELLKVQEAYMDEMSAYNDGLDDDQYKAEIVNPDLAATVAAMLALDNTGAKSRLTFFFDN
jgi:hypothetical protein